MTATHLTGLSMEPTVAKSTGGRTVMSGPRADVGLDIVGADVRTSAPARSALS